MAVILDQSGDRQGEQQRVVDVRGLLRDQAVTLADIPDSAYRFAVPQVDFNGFPIVDLSSPQYGTLTVNNLIATNLSAVAARTGSLIVDGALTISPGGNIHSGETAYNVGKGFWLDSGPRFSLRDANGNFINIDATGGNVLGISSSGISGALTSKQVDDAGLGNTSIWLNIVATPTTRAGYNITDAQATLPVAAAVGQVLQRDNGGSPYFSSKYGSELTITGQIFGTGTFTANAFVQLGASIGIPKPAIATTLNAFVSFDYSTNLGAPQLVVNFDYSTDGGATWTTGWSDTFVTNTTGSSTAGCIANIPSGTGDFLLRFRAKNSSGANTITIGSCRAIIFLCPNSANYQTTGVLAATIPSTGAGNCTATSPATTCTAMLNVTVTPTGGTPPYTFAWSVVSGTGTITSGSTSQTCTVSDTETATSGGATFNTTVKCVVTDSVPNNVTSNNDVITNTFTLVYSPITASVSTTGGSCSTAVCGNTCTATGHATANASGGNGSYTYSWSVVSGTATITAGSTSQTCTVQDTEATTAAPGTAYSSNLQCSVNDTRGTGAVTPQHAISLKFSCPA